MDLRRPTRGPRLALALGTLGLVATLAVACQLPGPTYVLTTTADQPDAAPGDGVCATAGGACSLRAAITEVNAGSGPANITLGDGATYVLTIAGGGEDQNATGDLDLHRTVAINGRSTIDGGGLDRVLDVRGGTLFLDGPTITGGELGASSGFAATLTGAGIRVATGAQLVAGSTTIEGNHAWHGGGGIASAGNVALFQSVVRNNETTGGVLSFEGNFIMAPGGGITMTAGDLSVTDSTLAGNTITGGGDGAAIHGTGTATVALVRSTVAGNSTTSGPAVVAPTLSVTTSTITDNQGAAAVAGTAVTITASTVAQTGAFVVKGPGSVTVRGSILTASASAVCSAPITSLGYTIATDASCAIAGPTDQPSTDPFLGPLGSNGGPTATRLPFSGSVALDAIPAGTPVLCDGATDQRGQVRPAGSACDIGSVEGSSTVTATPLALTVGDPGPAHDAAPGDGLCATSGGGCTLAAAVDETNAWPPADVITIAAGTNPVVDVLGLRVADDLVLHGNGASISGGLDQLLAVDGPSVTVDRATFDGTGSLVAARGALTLSEVTSNSAGVRVGAGTTVSVLRSTINGPIYGAGHAVITSSTVNSVSGTALSTGTGGGIGPGFDVRSSTIVGAPLGDIPAVTSGPVASIRFSGSVIVAGAAPACSPGGSQASLGYNVVSDTSCTFATTGDHTGAGPVVLGSAANGGPTATRLLYANSVAVDAIPNGTAGLCDASVPTDQRGLPRRVGVACDAGATEGPSSVTPTAPLALVVDRSADGNDVLPGDGTCLAAAGGCTLRAAIDEANAWPFADAITIAAGVAPVLSIPGSVEDLNRTGDLDISGPITITGTGTVVDGGHLDRVFDSHTGALTLRTLNIRGSGDPGYGGGAVRSVGSLTIRSVIVAANATDGVASYGPLTVASSSIVDNAGDGLVTFATASVDRVTVARNGASGIRAYGPLTVSRSTSSDNATYAVYVAGYQPIPATITASTLVGGSSAEYTLFNDFERPTTIVATAITTANPVGKLCANPVASSSYNRTTDATCNAPGVGSAVVTTLGLGPLSANGGSTATRLPSATSPLLDVVPTGSGSCTAALPQDQRLLPRPSGPACDVGAVERQP